jgi:uncharacterized protein (TIGR03000 family)
MFQTTWSLVKAATLACVVLVMSAAPSEAQRHGGHGGGHGGWGGRGGYGGYGGYRGGYGGYRGGYGGYRGGYGGWGYGGWGGYYGGWGYPYYGGYYGPSYGYYEPYAYSTPYYVTPSYSTYQSYPSGATASSPADNTAMVEVTLPSPAAQVRFNGKMTNQTGTQRLFVTPPLTPGQTYTYEITATWMVNGQPVTRTQQVRVEANKQATVNFQ